MASEKITALVEQVKELTVLELSELVHIFKYLRGRGVLLCRILGIFIFMISSSVSFFAPVSAVFILCAGVVILLIHIIPTLSLFLISVPSVASYQGLSV